MFLGRVGLWVGIRFGFFWNVFLENTKNVNGLNSMSPNALSSQKNLRLVAEIDTVQGPPTIRGTCMYAP